MRLIFVRHGEPDYEHDCLTENGRVQAESTAVRLHREPIREIFASPMGRTMETASYTARDHGLKIQTLDYMHEIDWGTRRNPGDIEKLKYDGHPWTLACDMLAEDPEYVGSPEWYKHPYFAENKCTEFHGMISEKIDEFLSGYGLERRNGLYFCKEKCDDTIALFAHGGSGACMISHIFSLPFPFVLSAMPYGVCSVTVIAFDSEEGKSVVPRFELFNDIGHIEHIKAEKLKFEK